MRPECGFAFVNLVKEEVVRIVRQHEDIELKAAGLLDGRCGVFCNSLKKLIALRRHKIQVDGIDVGRGS